MGFGHVSDHSLLALDNGAWIHRHCDVVDGVVPLIVFGVESEIASSVVDFVEKSRNRLDLGFSGRINLVEHKEKFLVLVGLEPRFPPLWRYVTGFAIVVAVALTLLFGFRAAYGAALMPMIFEVSMFSSFHSQLFVKGLRKSGYKGSVRTLSNAELLRYLVDHGSN